MLEAQPRVAPLDVPRALRDTGKRSFIRLLPNPDLPARMTIDGQAGWRFADRSLRDISVGGASFWVSFWEAWRVRVGDGVLVRLVLPTTQVGLNGRCVHMTGPSEWWAQRSVGVAFSFDRAYEQSRPELVEYLLRLSCAAEPYT